MPDILHRVGVKAPVARAYDALATRDGLAGWWTHNTQGESTVGGTLQFRFGAGGFDMKVLRRASTPSSCSIIRAGGSPWR